MAEGQFVISLDVGGSSVKSGVVNLVSHQISQFTRTPIDSRASATVIIKSLSDIIETHFKNTSPVIGIGFGFPGPFDYVSGVSWIEDVEKYEAIYGLNIHDALKADLTDTTLPIYFRNDAEAAIVGEGVHGAGEDYSRIIGLTLGTGCGSAFLIDGVPQVDGIGIPQNGWVYQMAYRGEQVDDVFSTRGLLKRLSSASLDVNTVLDAIQQASTNSSIRNIFAEFGDDLAQFLLPVIRDFNADALIVQGGIAHGFPYFEDAMNNRLAIPIFAGRLGQNAALLGIANLFKK